jgi:dipeptidyl aminopeptidase/acylaminoacyl peptidase
MIPEDVYELTGVGDPRLHPDGRTVAYVVWWIDREENTYGGAIWVASTDGSVAPRQLTSGDGRDGSPRWSPDGRRLAFVSKRGDDKAAQLYVLPYEGPGELRRLTSLREDVAEPVWSPDGARLAFSSRVRDEAYEEEDDRRRRPRRFTRLLYKLDNVGWVGDRRTQLFVVDADGAGKPRQLTFDDGECGSPSWSPDGTRLVFSGSRGDDWDLELVSSLWAIDADGGEPERLTPGDAECDAPSWSPDGSRIGYRHTPHPFDTPRHTQIAVLDLDSREQRVLTAGLDRQCGPYPSLREPIWDGDRIVFGVEDHGNLHVYAVGADGSAAPKRLVGGERVVAGYDCRDGTVVHAASTHTTLRELYVGDERLTRVGSAFCSARELGEPERFEAVSKDGSQVEGWVLRPAGLEAGKRYPVLLNVHGGPFTQYGTGFFDEFQVYAGAGYAVVFSNPRGSSGYSEEWGRGIRGPANGGPGWGSVDFEDVTAVLDEALRRFDFLDPDRTGIMGGSYGGFMTSWAVGHTDRFKAAVSERAVNQMLAMHGSSDIFWVFSREFGAYAFDDPQSYLERSPATYARNITTPLLIMHSEQDLRCNVEQAEHLFVTLRLLRKEVELLRFPAESHELTRSGSPVHRVMRFDAVLEWFDRYLK